MPATTLNFQVPANGGTLTFAGVAVGGSSYGVATLLAAFGNDNATDIIVTTPFPTGPGAAAYVRVNTLHVFTPSLTQQTLTYKFTPTSTTTFLAVETINIDVSRNGLPIGNTSQFINFTGTGTTAGAAGEAPSLITSFRRELVPTTGTTGIVLSYLNELNFNDAIDSRTYIFKAEDILADRVPTVRRVIITYVDLGVATVTATINGVDDSGALVTAAATVTLGTVGASGRLMTAFFDMGISCFRPQLTLSQAPNGGPFQLSTAMITGTVEKQVTL